MSERPFFTRGITYNNITNNNEIQVRDMKERVRRAIVSTCLSGSTLDYGLNQFKAYMYTFILPFDTSGNCSPPYLVIHTKGTEE